MNELMKAGMQVTARADLPKPLQGVEGFIQNADGAYSFIIGSDPDVLPVQRPICNTANRSRSSLSSLRTVLSSAAFSRRPIFNRHVVILRGVANPGRPATEKMEFSQQLGVLCGTDGCSQFLYMGNSPLTLQQV